MARKIKPADLSLMTRRLSDLLGGGITLSRAIDILRDQSQNRLLSNALGLLGTDLERGKSFSEALAAQPKIFSEVYCGMVCAGESSGNLEASLDELARLLENEMEARQKIRAALAYPAFLLVLGGAVSFFLTLFVIPRFQFLFDDLGQQLPLPTRIIIGFSTMLRSQMWIVGLVLCAAAWLMKKHAAALVVTSQKFLLKCRWTREFVQSIYLHRWAGVMSSLVAGGFSVPDAMRLSRQTFGNRFYSAEIDGALERVTQGHGLSESLSVSALFPSMVCELVGAGEEAGRLDESFAKISRAYQREMEIKTKLALSFLEPALVLGMGAIVGFVAIGMLLPIFEMSAGLR